MKIDLASIPYFFAAGFTCADENVPAEKCIILNRLLDDIFNLRFNKKFEVLEKEVFNSDNSFTFKCRITTNTRSKEEIYRASFEALFSFTCEDVTIDNHTLKCQGISELKIIDLNNESEPTGIKYAEWANSMFKDQLMNFNLSVAAMLSAQPHRMKMFLSDGGYDLSRTLEDYIEEQRKLKSAYFLVKTEIFTDNFEVENSYILRSLSIQDSSIAEYLKNAYLAIGDSVGFNYAFLRHYEPHTKEISFYEEMELKDQANVVKHADFFMGNKDQSGFLKIVSIEAVSLDEIQASIKVAPKVIDIDLFQEVGVS